MSIYCDKNLMEVVKQKKSLEKHEA
jgi:hypothetical protein